MTAPIVVIIALLAVGVLVSRLPIDQDIKTILIIAIVVFLLFVALGVWP